MTTISLHLTDDDRPIPALDPQVVRRAALAVCDRARDADDAALLLDVLGLIDGHGLATPRPAAGVLNCAPVIDIKRGRR